VYNKTSVCLFFKTGRLGNNKIIPKKKQKYSLLGSKNKEFIDFSSVLFLVKSKSHLTAEGLNQILEILEIKLKQAKPALYDERLRVCILILN
jgi:hypothetical protein